MAYEKMTDLLKKQEEERMELAAGVYEQWQPIGKKERELLADYQGDFENAPPEIQTVISKSREEFFTEWGSDGRLAALMEARHEEERERLVKLQEKIERIKQEPRKKENDRGR